MRKKLLIFNTLSSLIFQITTIICGFILPRLILQTFGSTTNGLVNSITQFLQIISFMELGVGAVVQSALYKPLVDKDNKLISKITVSARRFFKQLARILLAYIVLLTIFYPFVIKANYSWSYTAVLIISMSISSFAQYYFGIVDRLLLTADQHGFIQYNSQTITLILNTVACAVLINMGSSIQMVKLTTSVIYLFRPIYLHFYVNNHYSLDRKITYVGEPIKQKWNGVAQHISAVVLDGTDAIVLTLFSSLSNVSIYSVYFLVANGVTQLFISMTNGMQSLCGELWARRDDKKLIQIFGKFEWLIHTGTIFVFGCAGVLIVPFVKVYTNGINDANYIQPLFALVFIAANAGHCLRLPYNIMILAGGHYKQTQKSYIVAAIMNIVLSVLFVSKFGLIGVALGTLIAMVYQTVWMAVYNSKHFIKWPLAKFYKQIFVDFFTIIAGSISTITFVLTSVTYMGWILLAIEVTFIWGLVILIVNTLFYRDKVFDVLNSIRNRF